jgi:undecaprenyl diphosphate synthase
MHVAIIMDGNGRWATRRGRPRAMGHRAGAKALTRIVEAAPNLGVERLTVFAFSADNWRRPPAEVDALMGLLRTYLRDESGRHARAGTRLSFIGRRDRLPGDLAEEMARAEDATAEGERLHLSVALDYSARAAMACAAPGPDVDLLIRTGGEKRLSDFLLWECAYAELAFLDVMWPDFTPAHLSSALTDFHGRDRRFGALSAAIA